MKTSDRGAQRRAPFRTALTASLAMLGLCGGLMSGVAQANDSDANASCRQETKRVAVWPKGPKARQARFEEREVTVCDSAVAKRDKDAEGQTNSSGD